MNPELECEECRRLLSAASDAITQQLRATGRLDLARLRYDADLTLSLEGVLQQTKRNREEAVSAYKRHRRSHGSGESARAQAT